MRELPCVIYLSLSYVREAPARLSMLRTYYVLPHKKPLTVARGLQMGLKDKASEEERISSHIAFMNIFHDCLFSFFNTSHHFGFTFKFFRKP